MLAASFWILVVAISEGGEVSVTEPSMIFNQELECRTQLVIFAAEMFKDLPWAGVLYDQGLLAIECIPGEFIEK